MAGEPFIRVLGPIDVVRGGAAVSVGGRHSRALLGVLAIAAGHVISSDRLEWAMWGEHRPVSADDSLHTYVSRLRHLLGRDVLQGSSHGYRLAVTREQIDALRFEDLFVDAERRRDDPGECLRRCHGALGLWRGDPFGDLADDDAFRLETMRLDGLRLSTMELALACELALGRTAAVVAELESAVEEHPYREHLWHLLIDALARDGRRVEALRAAQRLRGVLAEVGLGPSEELTALENQILHHQQPPEPST